MPIRPLPVLVCCEAAVLMVLAVLWFQRSADAGLVDVPRVAERGDLAVGDGPELHHASFSGGVKVSTSQRVAAGRCRDSA